ncbi:MAG: hypothetical protein NZ523_02210 [Elioraea sp.]|nr:hypothetical protein [Elioraea sp.]
MTTDSDPPQTLETSRPRRRPFQAEEIGPWSDLMADRDVVRFLGTVAQVGRRRTFDEAWTSFSTPIG